MRHTSPTYSTRAILRTTVPDMVDRPLPVGRSLVFGDIGSGCGRLVVAQALTWPWKSCRGVEIVPSLHDIGQAALQEADRVAKGDENTLSPETLRLLRSMAPCSLSLGDVNDDVSRDIPW